MQEYDEQNLIVSSLQKQLRRYKEEVQLWKLKYSSLEKQHNQLLQLLSTKKIFQNIQTNKNTHQQNAFFSQNKKNTEEASMQLLQDDQFVSPLSLTNSQNQQLFSSFIVPQAIKDYSESKNEQKFAFKKVSPFGLNQIDMRTQGDQLISPQRSPRFQQDDIDDIDFFSIDQIKKHTSCEEKLTSQTDNHLTNQQKLKKGLDLIEGYFILQKIEGFRQNIKNHHLWVKSANEALMQKQKNLLQIIYRYTFREEPLSPIEDDPFDSRVNEIKYGTPYEQLIYSFDNFQPNEQNRSKVIFKAIRKKYIHCLIRPEITQIQGKKFETEILYGFISPFPFRTFFQDLHRTLHQEIKFEIINSCKVITQEVQVSKQMRIDIVSKLMKSVFQKGSIQCSNIQNFPIKISIQTKVSTLKLQIETQDAFRQLERESLQILLKKYNLLKLCKILHYVLTQKQLILVSTSRKNLNQIFQIVRLITKPFYWVFPVVYRYSDHFEPFLASPLPLIIGMVFDFNNKNYKDNKILTNNEFVTIFVEQNNPSQKETFFFFSSNKPKYSPNDLRQLSIYEKDIQFLFKYITKPDKKSKSNQSQKIQKYINRLKRLILTGSLETQLSTFMIEFLDSQMVQSFRDLLHGSNKKLDQQDDYNEEFTMTK